jgi:ComF family protein
MTMRVVPRLRGAGVWFLDAVLPPLCMACREPIAGPGRLCAACFAGLEFIGPPQCAICGAPFAAGSAEALVCGACLAHPPAYARGRAAVRYGDAARDLVLAFKHADRTENARPFAAMMARAGADLLREADVIVPVPLHRWRLLRRRYNQAALLARELARLSGRPWAPGAMVRRRSTPSQGRLGRHARFENVRGSFIVAEPGSIAARAILLVDDVVTTGATAGACAKALRRAGAARVDLLTFAQVTRPASPP